VVDFTNNNDNVMKRFKYTYVSDEIYFQTVLLNSMIAGDTIVNDNLRYIDWSSKKRGLPAFLDITDYEKIKLSNKIFARKFHEVDSDELKRLLIVDCDATIVE
jgi:hypothetical protein